jgi:hypothetical protein
MIDGSAVAWIYAAGFHVLNRVNGVDFIGNGVLLRQRREKGRHVLDLGEVYGLKFCPRKPA